MACQEVYADAFDFAMMWLCKEVEVGVTSAGVLSADLTDATKTFTDLNIEVGSCVYNATLKTYGEISAVAANVLATDTLWNLGDAYQIVSLDVDDRAVVEHFLRLGAGDITASLITAGATSCAMTCADAFLRKLNVVLAAVMYKCPCARPSLTDDERLMFMQWVLDSLEKVRTGELELCDGETGKYFPALAYAQMSWTPWRAAEIIVDGLLDI